MSYELEYDEVEYDTGYGVHYGTLVFDASPIFTDERFDAHGPGGHLQVYGEKEALTDWELDGTATLFLVGNNGEEIGEVELDKDEVLKLISEEMIMSDLVDKHY